MLLCRRGAGEQEDESGRGAQISHERNHTAASTRLHGATACLERRPGEKRAATGTQAMATRHCSRNATAKTTARRFWHSEAIPRCGRVCDGAIDGESFRAYIEQILVPTLQPGDIVIADNLGAHKVAGIQRAIQAAGATLW